MINDQKRRRKLEQLFFKLAADMVGGEESARDVIDSIYPEAKRSTQNLTIDQFAAIVKEVGKLTGQVVNLSWMYPEKNKPNAGASKPMNCSQFFLLLKTAEEKNIGQTHLANIMKKFAGGKMDAEITSQLASKVISWVQKDKKTVTNTYRIVKSNPADQEPYQENKPWRKNDFYNGLYRDKKPGVPIYPPDECFQ